MHVLDTNVFIGSARRYYGFDIAPGFWESMIELSKEGKIQSIEPVKEELLKGNDDLTDWATDAGFKFAATRDPRIGKIYGDILQWVRDNQVHDNQRYTAAALDDLEKNADGWLVAYAKDQEAIVVTNEKSHPDSKTRVCIPDICAQFEVQCVEQFQMMRQLGVQWPRL